MELEGEAKNAFRNMMNALAGDTSRVGLFKRNLGMNAAAMAMAMAEAVNGLDSEAQSP